MRRGNPSRRRRRPQQRRKTLYMRATVLVVNQDHKVLLVKHNGQNECSLPGGRMVAGEDPARRAVLEVAEETGLHITQPRHEGRYAGTVAAHEIYLAQSSGEPRPNPREIQDAIWWDRIRPLQVHQHVSAVLATVGNSIGEVGAWETGADNRNQVTDVDQALRMSYIQS